MDVSRIERALRDGPADEPVYAPGAFRRSGRRGISPLLVSAVVGLALVAGIAIGTGLALLRHEPVGNPPQSQILVAADLLGTWRTEQIDRQAWIDGVTTAGFDSATITAFLDHDPIQTQVRYTLRFSTSPTSGGQITIEAEYDGRPVQVLSAGTFTVDESGVFHYTEIVPGSAAPRVSVTATAAIADGQLSFQILDEQNATTDDLMANTVFFELAPYTKQGP